MMQPIDVVVFHDSEYILGSFETTERPWEFLCRRPDPSGSWVFANKMERTDGEVWPKQHEVYLVMITGNTKSGRARRGNILVSIKGLSKLLCDELKRVTWQLNRYGRPEPQEVISTPYGDFRPVYDSGYRSNGADLDPSIVFEPVNSSPLSGIGLPGYLGTWSSEEIDRVKAAKFPEGVHPAPGLGELMARKMAADQQS